MIIDGYLIVRFKHFGTGILSVKVGNIYERVLFKKKDNADNFMKKIPNNKDLCLYYTSMYANNKIIYEDNYNIEDVDICKFAIV